MKVETRRRGGDKHGPDQRISGGGVEKELNSTYILKIEPAEFIRSLALAYKRKSNPERLQGFGAEKLRRV